MGAAVRGEQESAGLNMDGLWIKTWAERAERGGSVSVLLSELPKLCHEPPDGWWKSSSG